MYGLYRVVQKIKAPSFCYNLITYLGPMDFYNAYAQHCTIAIVNPSVYPSVRLSVTGWYCVKNESSYDHAVFTEGTPVSPRTSKGNSGAGAPNERMHREIRD